MAIQYAHGRLFVGYRRTTWIPVWYEPIFEGDPNDPVIQGLVPEIALYLSSSRRRSPEVDDVMVGEVAWEPLFEPTLYESKEKKERIVLQKKMLYDAYWYLKAKRPADIATIKGQLDEGGPRLKALVKQCEKVMKQRARAANGRRRQVARNGGTAVSIEGEGDVDSTESESGYESDNGGPRRTSPSPMPPPPRPAPRRPDGGSDGGFGEELMMSGIRGSSMGSSRNAHGNDAAENNDGGSASAGSRRSSASAPAPRGTKRKRPFQSESQHSSGPRTFQEDGPVFVTQTPSVTQQHTVDGEAREVNIEGHAADQEERPVDDEDDNILEGFNGARDERAAMAEAMRASRATSQRRSLRDTLNGGLDDEEALHAAMRASVPPEQLPNAPAGGNMRGAEPHGSLDPED